MRVDPDSAALKTKYVDGESRLHVGPGIGVLDVTPRPRVFIKRT